MSPLDYFFFLCFSTLVFASKLAKDSLKYGLPKKKLTNGCIVFYQLGSTGLMFALRS